MLPTAAWRVRRRRFRRSLPTGQGAHGRRTTRHRRTKGASEHAGPLASAAFVDLRCRWADPDRPRLLRSAGRAERRAALRRRARGPGLRRPPQRPRPRGVRPRPEGDQAQPGQRRGRLPRGDGVAPGFCALDETAAGLSLQGGGGLRPARTMERIDAGLPVLRDASRTRSGVILVQPAPLRRGRRRPQAPDRRPRWFTTAPRAHWGNLGMGVPRKQGNTRRGGSRR